MKDTNATIQQLKNLVEKFRKKRNWGTHHNPRNLAISIAIEAAELMEHFQWDDYKEEGAGEPGSKALSVKLGEFESELADIIIYCLYFALSNKIDIAKAVEKKIDTISKKYPASVFNNKKDDPKDYWRIKKKYRNRK